MTSNPSKGELYLNGQWITGQGETLQSINPADNQVLWEGRMATGEDVSVAVNAAHKALAHWAALPWEERSCILQAFAQQVTLKKNELSLLISLETGKPLWESATEVSAVIGKVMLSIQAFQERTFAKQGSTPEATTWLRYKPHGVVAVLGAFNFPAHLSNGHIVPALLAGNTVVYKPSELTPAVAAFIMQCWHDSGLPPGVINCVQGSVYTGERLLSSDIQGVYFTGSYRTGKRIHQQFSHRPDVILALEMGGNNPLVIDDVADHEAAVYQTIVSTLITSGQRCTCARRVLIKQSSQGDRILDNLIQAIHNLKQGDFRDQPEPFIGPVISHHQALALLRAQSNLLESGGKSLLSMSLLQENTGFVSPGVIDMTQATNVADEEIFGPLIQIYRYQTFEQALAMANQTQYGLAAGLLSDSQERYQQFYQSIRAGLINWNRPTTGAASTLPFGGVGHSGNHRPSAYFAADYCSYPIASMEQPILSKPHQALPGMGL
jgi:succinylglutamic semialdehyde dehydrogenase